MLELSDHYIMHSWKSDLAGMIGHVLNEHEMTSAVKNSHCENSVGQSVPFREAGSKVSEAIGRRLVAI